MATLDFTVLWRDHGAERGMKQLGERTERTGKSFRGLKVAGAAALAAVGVAAVKFGSDSVKAYVQAEASQLRLQDAFRKFPKLSDTNIGALRRLNTELAKKTRFDDDATASGQAVLAQFNLTGQQITKLTPLLQDYAAKTGKDLPTAARDLGKAVLGQGRSLKSVGINFKDTGTEAGNLEQITKGLRTQVGGFAEKEGKSAAGRAEILRNQFGELQEAAGKQLLPALMKAGNSALRFFKFIEDASPIFKSFKTIASATFSALTESFGKGRASFKSFGDYILTHQADIVGAFVQAGKFAVEFGKGVAWMAIGGLRAFGSLDAGVGRFISGFIDHVGTMLRVAAKAFGWIPGLGPKLKASSAQFDAWSVGAKKGFENQGKGAKAAADKLERELLPALDKSGRSLDATARKEIIKAQTRDAVHKAAIAVRGLGTDADGSQIKLKRWADRTKLGSDEQVRLRGRLREARDALRDKLTVMERNGAGQAKLTRAWEKGKDALYKEFRQMGLSKAEARRLATQYAGIPPKVETKVTQPGMKSARTDTKDLDTRINHLNGKKVTIKFGTNAKDAARALGISVKNYENIGGARSSVSRSDTGADPAVTLSHGRGSKSGGPTVSRNITVDTEGLPSNTRRLTRDIDPANTRTAKTAGEGLQSKGLGQLNKDVAAKKARDAATIQDFPGGRPDQAKVPRGWGPIYRAMRAKGARSFTTYPGHHPSSARARDVTPHSWAIANAARRLSSVWYVIYRMRIASKSPGRGNTWRQYHPTNRRGDWRHVRHVHVARYGDGTHGARRGTAIVGEHGPELLQMRGGERVTPLTRYAMPSQARVGGGGGLTIVINAPHWVGSTDDLRRTLVTMAGRNELNVVLRKAGVRV
jgi:hypothetical protein